MPHGMVENGAELVVDGFQIRLRIRLLLFIPKSQQLILPGDHVLCGNLADIPLPEIRQDLRLDDVLLREPGVFLEPGPDVLFI